MSVRSLPRLDRLFGSGSVLGLPSSFTGRPYTLTATAITEADVVHVAREDFLLLMLERPDLCREATEMLGRGNDLHPFGAGGASKTGRLRKNL
jgi:CRP-like cAMP-binding protein